MKNLTQLTPRQWATYNLIKQNTLLGKETTQDEIIANYQYSNDRKDGYVENKNPYAHDKCTVIWSDIMKINDSSIIQKQVICKDFKYKLSTSLEETKNFVDTVYYKPAMAKLHRRAVLLKKAYLDGQGKLKFDNESQARDFYESFVKDITEELIKSDYGTAN